jgi:PAS domain-containing protein
MSISPPGDSTDKRLTPARVRWARALSGAGGPVDPRAGRSARVAIIVAALINPLWQPLMVRLVPGARDPLSERLVLSGLCVAVLLWTAAASRRHYLIGASRVLVYLATAHFFSLIYRNDLAQTYVACAFAFITALTLSFVSVRSLLAYSTTAVAMAIGVAVAARGRSEEGIFLAAGVTSSQLMLTALSWRNLNLAAAARDSIRQARDFLGAVIDAVPDPVFVLDEELRPMIANEALSTATRTAPADIVGSILLDSTTATEREIPIMDARGQPRTALVKVAVRHLPDGERYLVGVVRDISERKALEMSLEQKIRELEEARAQVKQLRGLLPVCMHCGRIRSGSGDTEEWQDVRIYIEHHSEALFSHGLCQSCQAEHYP